MLVVGIAAGWVLANLVTGPRLWSDVGDEYALRVIEMTSVATRIRSGEQDELRNEIEAKMPNFVITIHKQFGDSMAGKHALWRLKRYYRENGLEPSGAENVIFDQVSDEHPAACSISPERAK